jgi:hypothetical protein
MKDTYFGGLQSKKVVSKIKNNEDCAFKLICFALFHLFLDGVEGYKNDSEMSNLRHTVGNQGLVFCNSSSCPNYDIMLVFPERP